MKKTNLLNSEISSVISKMGHTDTLCISDCGLPIPRDVKRIDLALTKGMIPFLNVLEATLSELCVEEVTVATETQTITINWKGKQQTLYDFFCDTFPIVHTIPHSEFKQETQSTKAIIRTGETTPYANILLHSGVTF